MITSIDLIRLRNSEFLQFMTDVLGIVNLNNATKLQVKQQYTNLQTLNKAIDGLFVTDNSNPITEELQILDARRDNAINGITAVINGYTYHFNAATKAQATILNNHLALFGIGIARNNYQSETTILRNIIADWNTKPELKTAITSLDLTSWKTELEAANNAFATRYLSRTQQLGAASTDTIAGKRAEATTAYYALRDRLDAFFTIHEGAEPYTKTTNELNALINQYNIILTARKVDNTTPVTEKEEVK